MTADDIIKANEQLKAIDIRGKGYVQVNERLKAFRSICPNGSVQTEIVSLEDGKDGKAVVTMKSTITDENGKILGTGYAQEIEGSSNINKTSFIENCETSAVGRALGWCGIGVDASMASAEEVANAILNQNKEEKKPEERPTEEKMAKKITDTQVKTLRTKCETDNVDEAYICKSFHIKDLKELTGAQYKTTIDNWERVKVKGAK